MANVRILWDLLGRALACSKHIALPDHQIDHGPHQACVRMHCERAAIRSWVMLVVVSAGDDQELLDEIVMAEVWLALGEECRHILASCLLEVRKPSIPPSDRCEARRTSRWMTFGRIEGNIRDERGFAVPCCKCSDMISIINRRPLSAPYAFVLP